MTKLGENLITLLLIKGHGSWCHVIRSRVDMSRWIINIFLRKPSRAGRCTLFNISVFRSRAFPRRGSVGSSLDFIITVCVANDSQKQNKSFSYKKFGFDLFCLLATTK